MRAWTIVLSSAAVAATVTAALGIRQMLDVPASHSLPLLGLHLPALAVAALAVYALCAMLMVTATRIAAVLHVRRSMEAASDRGDRVEGSGANGFRQFAVRLGLRLAPAESAELDGVVRGYFALSEVRRQFARAHYIFLGRVHFFSAVILLAGIVGLGVAQERGSLSLPWGTIPTMSGTLVLVGLLLLTFLCRIAFDVTAEPLLEAVPQLPAERTDLDLLRRIANLLERQGRRSAVVDETATATPGTLPEGLLASIEQGHHALLEAVGRLSANTEELSVAMQSSAEMIETVIRTTAAQQRVSESERAASVAIASPELQAAVEQLTVALQRLTAAQEIAGGTVSSPGPVPPQRTASPPLLARELRGLLQEIDASR